MVKRFKITVLYTTSNDNATEEDIKRTLKIEQIGAFDTYKTLYVNEI